MTQQFFRSYIGSCDFNVGTLFAHDGYALMLAQMCEKEGIAFPIDYVFGSVSCLFQGGRAAPLAFDRDNVCDVFDRYAQAGVGCRLTFSNCDIAEADLDDEESNFLLERLNQGENNGVIVSSDVLADYIRASYPKLQIISSLVKPTVENKLGTEGPEYYNALFDRYDIVVVNSAFAFDDEYLAKIEHPGRVEFIVNHRCRPNCPLSKDHYTTQTLAARAASTGNFIAQRRLEGKLVQINEECLRRRHEAPLVNSLISASRVEELVKMGFRHFKLEGRDYPLPVMVRDVGTWIFEPDGVYLSMTQALFNTPI